MVDLPKVSTPELSSSAALGSPLPAFVSPVAGSIPLLVSDNPETVDTAIGDTGALSEFLIPGVPGVPGGSPDVVFRLFLWHLNHLGKHGNIGITIENAGTTVAEIVRIVHAVGTDTGGSFLAVGKSAAEELLSGGQADTDNLPLSLPPGSRILLRRFVWPRGRLLGGQLEITARGVPSAPGDGPESVPPLIVRTVCAPARADLTALRDVTSALVSAQPHPYGCWPYSEIAVAATFTISAAESRGQLRLADKGAAPGAAFTADEVVPGSIPAGRTAIGNPAGFGAVFGPVEVTLENRTGGDVSVRVLLSPRGGDFAGAARLPDGAVRGIPHLKAGIEAADLGTVRVPFGESVAVTYTFAVAGAASTPFALFFRSVPL